MYMAYKPVLGTQGVRSIIHPLCGCATNVIKKSPSRYNVVVQARAIGQKVCVTNPNKPDSYLNDVARSIQLHLPT